MGLFNFDFLWITVRILNDIQWNIRILLFLLIKVKLTKSLVFVIIYLAKAILGSRRRVEISWITVLIVDNTSIVLNLRQSRLLDYTNAWRLDGPLFGKFIHVYHLLLTAIISCYTLFHVTNSVIIYIILYVLCVISFLDQLTPILLIIGVSNAGNLFIFLRIFHYTIVLFLLVVKTVFVHHLIVF